MEALKQVENDVLLFVVVKTLQRDNRIYLEEGKVILHIKDPPIKGKANKTIVKTLRKQFKKEVKLESGFSSTHKVIRIKDIDLDEIRELIVKENN